MLAQRFGLGLSRQLARGPLSALTRGISTVKTSKDYEQDILVAQRKNRPCSPHLTIYEPQLTAILSTFHRVTGVYMAGGFYLVTCGYAFASLIGSPIDTGLLVESFSTLPEVVKLGCKSLMAYPFIYHFANGVRHLIWDSGRELTIKGVYRTGYTVLAVTAVVGTFYSFFV